MQQLKERLEKDLLEVQRKTNSDQIMSGAFLFVHLLLFLYDFTVLSFPHSPDFFEGKIEQLFSIGYEFVENLHHV